MKIYNKNAFFSGLCLVGVMILDLCDVWSISAMGWPFVITFAGRFLYTGLSQTANERQQFLAKHYKTAALQLYGKYYWVRTNLPWLVTAIFLLVLRLLIEGLLPMWIYGVFMIILLGAVMYSLGVSGRITEYIDKHMAEPRD